MNKGKSNGVLYRQMMPGATKAPVRMALMTATHKSGLSCVHCIFSDIDFY